MNNKTQKLMLDMIKDYISVHGYAPTIREIGNVVGIKSTSTVHVHLKRLLEEGQLESDAGIGSPRAIRVPGYKFVKES